MDPFLFVRSAGGSLSERFNWRRILISGAVGLVLTGLAVALMPRKAALLKEGVRFGNAPTGGPSRAAVRTAWERPEAGDLISKHPDMGGESTSGAEIPNVGRPASDERPAGGRGIGAWIANALRGGGPKKPSPAPPSGPDKAKLQNKSAPTGSASGSMAIASAGIGPGGERFASPTAFPAPARYGEPPSILDRFRNAMRSFLNQKAPPAPPAPPSRFAPAGPSSGGGPAPDAIAGLGSPTSASGSPPMLQVPKAEAEGASLSPAGRGGSRGGSIRLAPIPKSCPEGTQARPAPTHDEPNRVVCDPLPIWTGPPTREKVTALRERLAGVLRVTRDSILYPGLDAVRQTAAWSLSDVEKAQGPIGEIDVARAQMVGWFASQSGPEAQRAVDLFAELSKWFNEEDGPVKGLQTVQDRLVAANGCLEGQNLGELVTCHDDAVIPGLGRGLKNQAVEVAYLEEALRDDKDLNKLLADLKAAALAMPDAPQAAMYDRLNAFVLSARLKAADAAMRMDTASRAWDTFKSGGGPGAALDAAVRAQGKAHSAIRDDLAASGVFSVEGGMAVWSGVLSADTAFGDSRVGWARSHNSYVKPVERIEGAVDGSIGALSAMILGTETLDALDLVIPKLKD